MEFRKEFSDFIQDRWAGARNWTSISIPTIVSVLLAIQGKPDFLIVGLSICWSIYFPLSDYCYQFDLYSDDKR
jgi:hypothetical protein